MVNGRPVVHLETHQIIAKHAICATDLMLSISQFPFEKKRSKVVKLQG